MDTKRTLRVNLLLAALGAVAGAIAAIPITVIGKLVTGAEPATLSNYVWNMGALAIIAAINSPLLTWSVMRRVPLWRTVAEPLIGGVAGGAIALGVGVPLLFLPLIPAGIVVAVWRLHRVYREPGLVALPLPLDVAAD